MMRVIVLLTAVIFSAVHPSSSFGQKTVSVAKVSDYRVVDPQALVLQTPDSPSLSLTLQGWGQQFQLELNDNARLLEQVSPRQRAELRSRGDRFLKGTLAGVPGSWVRLNRIDGRVSGVFYDGSELYLVDGPGGFDLSGLRAADPSSTVLVRFEDLELDGLIDMGGLDTGQPKTASADYEDFVAHLQEIAEIEGATLLSMPVTIVADTFFQDELGANAESVAVGRVNFVDGIFGGQLGVGISLWHYEALSDNGPMTSTDSGELLSPQFRSFMSTGDGSSIPFRGLAHLFTGRNLDGNTVGRAFIGGLCNRSWGYGLDENLGSDTVSSLVFAHELGHNFTAGHDDEGIMRATIGGSQEFSDASIDVMSGAVAGVGCLVEGGLRIFGDGFEP